MKLKTCIPVLGGTAADRINNRHCSAFPGVPVRMNTFLIQNGIYQINTMRLTTTLLLAVLTVLPAACNRLDQGRNITVFNGLTMGTSYDIKLELPAAVKNREVIRQGIKKVLDDVNHHMSTYLPDSELSKINQNKSTGKIPISDELTEVLAMALEISRFTGGAFDITVGPLVNLWGFGPVKKAPVVPPREAITRTLAATGYKKIKLGINPDYIIKSQPDLYLDLSGIAKGYGVDKIADYLDSQAVKNYMIEVGGEIKARGTKPDNTPWRIGIEKPVSNQQQVERIMQLDNLGMATSGDYRNFFDVNGKRYTHIIDPTTGYPVSHNLVSVSVLDESTARADALATALVVMGPEKGVKFAAANHISAMFIIRTGTGFTDKYTGSFKNYLIKK